MASLLGEYQNTFQRVNPAQGLMQGAAFGANFMGALQQQKMAQQQADQQQKEQKRANDMQLVGVLFTQAKQSQSKTMRANYIQRAHDILNKWYPGIGFDATIDPNEETFNKYISKIGKFSKPLVENSDAAIKDLQALLVEIAEEEEKGNIEEGTHKKAVAEAGRVRQEAAGELGGLVTYPEQFRGEPAYETPEAETGIAGYQKGLLAQMKGLDPGIAAKSETAWQKSQPPKELELDPETVPVIAELYRETGIMPPLGFGSTGLRQQILNEVASQERKVGGSGKTIGGRKAAYQANTAALRDLTKRQELIGTFTNRIDANVDYFEKIRKKYGADWSRIANVPVNKLKSIMGSGDYQRLKLILKSISNEVAKVESGSLGIAEVSVSQAEYMEKIHDPDLTMNDIMKVLEASKELGHLNIKSIDEQRLRLKKRLIPGQKEQPEETKTIIRTGKDKSGRKVVQYSDGSIEYAE